MSKKNCFKFLFVFLFVLSGSTKVNACECEPSKSGSLAYIQSDSVVIIGKILKHYDQNVSFDPKGPGQKRTVAMDVEVVESLNGDETQKIIKVWGDPGWMCRKQISGFAIGSQWILIPHKIEVDVDYGKKGDYEVLSCSPDTLELKDGQVVGKLKDGSDINVEDSISLDEFRKRVQAIHGQ